MPLAPALALALTLTPLQERVELRRQARMEQPQTQTTEVRLGRTIRHAGSLRRIAHTEQGEVVRVVDGSVILLKMADGSYRQIRTLGAEAPLIDTGSTKEQCFALEAKQKLTDLLLHKQVTLERDRDYQKDNQQRYLRYVRLGTLDVNGYMIDSGYSFADDENVHDRSSDYALREREAREYDRGLWGDYCTYNPSPSRTFEVIQ